MYYNKWIINRSPLIKTIHGEPQHYDLYQNFVDELHPTVRFEKYYFVSPWIACKYFDEDEFDGYDYLTLTDKLIDEVLNDKSITKDLEQGNTCIVFDMGAELIPFSYYEKIDKFYSTKSYAKNVKYWSMYEHLKPKGSIDYLTVSSSTLRFSDYEENKVSNEYHEKWEFSEDELTNKHVLFLNKRIRPHRLDTLSKLLEKKVNIKDNFYFSFLGTNNRGEGDPLYDSDVNAIYGRVPDVYNKDMANKILWDYYKTELPYSMNFQRDEWLASSSLNRIEELLPYRKRTYVELITEFTHSDEYVSISEKLSQAILCKKPFIIVGDRKYLRNIKNLGFKTFDKFWDESYDELAYEERIDAITDVVKEIVDTVDVKNGITYSKELQEILEHNYNHYKNVYTPSVYKDAFKSLSLLDYKPQLEDKADDEEVKREKTKYVWYSENTNTIIIPIAGNLDGAIKNKVAPRLAYRLVDKNNLDNVSKIPAIAITRHPHKRYASYLENNDDVNNDLLEQTGYMYDLNVCYTIDMDDIHREGYYARCKDWNDDFGHRDSGRRIADILYEEEIHTPRQLTPEEILFVDENYKWDWTMYNEYGSWRFRKPHNIAKIGVGFEQYFDTFKDVYKKEYKVLTKKLKRHSQYLESSLESAYWVNHSMILDNLGLNYAPKDIKILDIGTHFGFMPHFLKSQGFTNVHSTNSYKEAGDSLDELKLIWKTLGITEPADIHIEPQTPFDLLDNSDNMYGKDFDSAERYDIILMNMSNVFWKTDKIVRLLNGNISQAWQVVDKNKDTNTFFAPYDVNDIHYFTKCIMSQLKVGGSAVIQPFPYAYSSFDGFRNEQGTVATWQSEHRGHQKPQSTKHCPTLEMNNYFIIHKEKNE